MDNAQITWPLIVGFWLTARLFYTTLVLLLSLAIGAVCGWFMSALAVGRDLLFGFLAALPGGVPQGVLVHKFD